MSERPVFLTAMLLGIVVGFPVRSEVDLEDIYADHYEDARAKFLAAVKAAGGKLEHYRNPHLGSKGEALYTDVATFNLSGARTTTAAGR